MKTIVMLFALFSAGYAQTGKVGDVEYIIGPLGIPCDPSVVSMPPCPSDYDQGLLIFVRSTDADFDGYRLTIRFRNAAGEEMATSQSFDRRVGSDSDGGPRWSTEAFRIGRMKVPHLPGGIEVLAVSVQKWKIVSEMSLASATKDFEGYRLMVRYRDPAGIERTQAQHADALPTAGGPGWSTESFRLRRAAIANLPRGSEILSTQVEKWKSAPATEIKLRDR